MSESITVTVGQEKYVLEKGACFESLANQVQNQYPDDIALARFNGKLTELFKAIPGDGEVEFLTTKTGIGREVYRRSVTMMMQRAIHDVDKTLHTQILFSLSQGYFCRIHEKDKVDEKFLLSLKAAMEMLVERDLPIVKTSMDTAEAIELFKSYEMFSRGSIFGYRQSSKVNIYSIGNYQDYYYGYMMPRTGLLRYFDLIPYDDGFVLLFPDGNTKEVADFTPSHKLYQVLRESNGWSDMLHVGNIGELNDAIASGKALDLILVQEALQEKKLGEIAADIIERGSKFVMIAGPSSSGKTSFSHRLSVQLMSQGKVPHPIGLDNYYKNREETPRDENGDYDFECLEALDVELFNQNLTDLLAGKEVDMPAFNFKTGQREYRGDKLKLGKEDILVIEGIHGLNEKMSYTIDSKYKYKIYISALTQLNVDEHNCLHTTDGRLMRRIVRDNRTRHTTAKETLAMWKSVRRGEEKYIFPYQDSADAMFNSAFLYEMAVIKPYIEPLLYQIKPEDPQYDEAKRLLKLLGYILPIPSEDINHNSLFREFIGGSCFNV